MSDLEMVAFIQVREQWRDVVTGLEMLVNSPEYSEQFRTQMTRLLHHTRAGGGILAEIGMSLGDGDE